MKRSPRAGSEAQNALPFLEHLAELRRRLLAIAAAVVAGAAGAYAVAETLVGVLVAPAGDLRFLALSPPELFLAYIRISAVVGVIVTVPITVYQVWAFVRPALTPMEKRAFGYALAIGSLLFACGVAFCYFVILPTVLAFFRGFAVDHASPGGAAIAARYSFGAYTGFVLAMLFAFGAGFELPVLLSILVRLGLVQPRSLRQGRKYVAVGMLILAALLTPPDVVSQVLLAAPMYLLYEAAVLASAVMERSSSAERSRRDS